MVTPLQIQLSKSLTRPDLKYAAFLIPKQNKEVKPFDYKIHGVSRLETADFCPLEEKQTGRLVCHDYINMTLCTALSGTKKCVSTFSQIESEESNQSPLIPIMHAHSLGTSDDTVVRELEINQ